MNVLKRILGVRYPVLPTREDAIDSLFKKHGWYANRTIKCDKCNKLIYKGIFPDELTADDLCSCSSLKPPSA